MNQWTLPRCETSRFPLLTFPHSHFTQTPPCPEHPPHCSVSSPGCQALCKPSPKNNPCLKEHLALKDPQGITSFLHFLAAFTWSFCLWSTAFLFASWNPPFPLSWIPLSLILFFLRCHQLLLPCAFSFQPHQCFFWDCHPCPVEEWEERGEVRPWVGFGRPAPLSGCALSAQLCRGQMQSGAGAL